MSENERSKRMARLESQMEFSKLFAHYWMAEATTGATTRRHISRLDGSVLTDEEKIVDALNTAKQHINNYLEMAEARIALMP